MGKIMKNYTFLIWFAAENNILISIGTLLKMITIVMSPLHCYIIFTNHYWMLSKQIIHAYFVKKV